MEIDAKDMPKLFSPFIREEINGKYVVTPEIDPNFRWVFESSEAVEKLDGTNVSIVIEDGDIKAMFNRKNPIDIWKKGNKRFVEGILEATDIGIVDIKNLPDGRYYGELIGEKVNSDPYKIKGHLWLPFSYLRTKYKLKFWDKFLLELKDLDDEEIFEKVSELFKGLWSLFKRKRGIKGKVNENTVFEGMAAEGIVFYKKGIITPKIVRYRGKMSTFDMAKLRRDMFSWFKGREHKK